MTNLFSELGLPKAVVDAVTALGYTSPTPVQQQAIPALLSGRDVLAAAQTGTGKTAAFASAHTVYGKRMARRGNIFSRDHRRGDGNMEDFL